VRPTIPEVAGVCGDDFGPNPPPCVITVSSRPGTTYGSLQAAVVAASSGATIQVTGLCIGRTLISERSNLTIEGPPPVSGSCPPGPQDLRATLKGNGSGEVVKVLGSTNIIVRFLNIVDGGEHDGLAFWDTKAGTGHCNCVARNDEGYELDNGSRHKITDSLVFENTNGIRLRAGAVDSMVTGNISELNVDHGIVLLDSATERNMIAGNRSRANGWDCIHMDEADFNQVTGNVSGGGAATPELDCGRDDIHVQNDADSNVFRDNVNPDGTLVQVHWCSGPTLNGNTGNNCQ
jgi:nitrous oxidase accessory protein NosD